MGLEKAEPSSPEEWRAIQRALAPTCRRSPKPQRVVGVSFRSSTKEASASLFSSSNRHVIRTTSQTLEEDPTVLEFAVVQAWGRLVAPWVPDLIFVPGHGVSHPTGCGVASFLGYLLRCPSIGVSLRPPVGLSRQGSVSLWKKGSHCSYGDGSLCKEVKVQEGMPSIYVSPGWGLSMHEAIAHCLEWAITSNLPEPIGGLSQDEGKDVEEIDSSP